MKYMLLQRFWPKDTITKLLVVVLAIAISIGCGLRFLIGDDFMYTLWSDRELYRAYNLFREFQSSGPESNFGGRIPGGSIYYLLRTLMLVSMDPGVIHKMMLMLDCVAAVIVFAIGLRYLGLFSALTAAFFALTMSYVMDNLSQVWNPGFTSLPLALAFLFLIRLVVDRRENALPLFLLFTGIAAQAHFSAYGLIVVALLSIAMFRIRIGVRACWFGCLVFFLLLAPYFIHEATTGFANTHALISYHELAGIGGEEAPIRPWSFELLVMRLVDFLSWASGTIWYDAPDTLVASLKWFVTVLSTSFLGIAIATLTVCLGLRRLTGGPDEVQLPSGDAATFTQLCYLTVAVAVILVCALGLPPIPRYVPYALPALYLLGGVAVAELMNLVCRINTPALRYGLAISLTLWACVGGLLSVYYWPARAYQTAGTALGWREVQELLTAARLHYGLLGEQVSDRLAVTYRAPDGMYRSIDFLTSALEYPALLLESGKREGDIGQNCLLAIKKLGTKGRLSPDDARVAIERLSTPLGGAEPLEFHKTESFDLISYNPAGQNCLRNINNRYLRTAAEKEITHALASQPSDSSLELKGSPNERRFAFRKSGIWPLEAMISLDYGSAGTVLATIVSNDLRGYSGLVGHKIQRPRVEFRSRGQLVATLIIFDGEFGGLMDEQVLSPWSSRAILSPGAPHDIYVVFDGHVADRHELGSYELKLGSSE
jgi:hypothetical protein